MFRFLFAVLLSVLATAAAAQRPSTLGMSCGEAQRLVASHGAIVLSTGRHTYDRFVASPGFCTFGEFAYRSSAPTGDTPNCPLGYICKPDTPLWLDDDGLFLGD